MSSFQKFLTPGGSGSPEAKKFKKLDPGVDGKAQLKNADAVEQAPQETEDNYLDELKNRFSNVFDRCTC